MALASVSVLAISSLSTEAFARADADQGLAIEEVVVTAQKREQAVQDVPLSISVVDEATIRNAGATSLTEIQNMVPGVQLVNTNGVGTTQAAARGVTTIAASFEATPAVGLYVDETPISAFTSRFPETALNDVSRVEFLRGPQGTLFGEGSMAGTVRVITNKPDSHEISGSILARGYTVKGGDSAGGVSGVLNLPILEDKLALRVSGQSKIDAGWIDAPSMNAENINKNKQSDARVALRYTPTDELTVDLSHTYHKHAQVSSQQTAPGLYDPPSSTPGAGVPVRREVENLSSNLTDLTINYDLGLASLVTATAFYRQEIDNPRDFGPVAPLLIGPGTTGTALQKNDRTAKFFTQEVRLVSNGDNRLNWTVGGFYRKLERYQFTSLDFQLLRGGAPITDLSQSVKSTESTSYAIFGQADYDLTDTLSVTAGGRYYKDERNVVLRQLSSSAIFRTVAGTVLTVNAKDNAFSPNIQLNYKPDANVLIFGRIAKGFRSGGSNENTALNPTIPAGYGPESVWSYEVGVKTDPMPWLRLNAYGFYNKWTDIQLSFSTQNRAFTFTSNAGGADAYGVEFETEIRPLQGLSLSANLTYTRAELSEDVIDPAKTLVVSEGNLIPFVPKWSGGLSADYQTDMLGKTLFLHGDYRFRTKTFTNAANTPQLETTSLQNLNLRAGLGDDRWRISVFAENVTNRDDVTAAEYIVFLPVRQYVRPRVLGIELQARF
ncbi:TonB-dependent receptor [Phenylobacterium sp.]|uniref:TonB-dependent receptor n=1 Tax=Phenylobacterium sp. TaxID=1871053 RepID=UPI002FC65FE8